MKSNFEKMCESYGVIKTTKRIMYPRQIKLSEEFLRELKKEYFRQKLEEDVEKPVKHRPQKFIKALQFHVKEFEDNSAAELEAYKRMMDEDTEPYVAKVEGEKQEGEKAVDISKQIKRKQEIEHENIFGSDQDTLAHKQLQAQKKAKAKQPTKEGKKKYSLGEARKSKHAE